MLCIRCEQASHNERAEELPAHFRALDVCEHQAAQACRRGAREAFALPVIPRLLGVL